MLSNIDMEHIQIESMLVELIKVLFTSKQSDSLRTGTSTCSENKEKINESTRRLEKVI